jgi:type I restriction enzyme M protein
MVDRIDPKVTDVIIDPSCGTGGFLTCSIRHVRKHYVRNSDEEAILQRNLRAIELKQLPHMLCVTNMLLHGIEDASFVRHENTLQRPYESYGKIDQVDVVLTNPPFGATVPDGVENSFPATMRTKETADLFLLLIIRLLKPGGRAAVVLPDGSLFGEGAKTRIRSHLLQECNVHTIVRLPNSVFRPYASIGTNLVFFEKRQQTRSVWFYELEVPAGQKAFSMGKPIQFDHFAECISWWGGSSREGRKPTQAAWEVSIDDIAKRNFNLDYRNPHKSTDQAELASVTEAWEHLEQTDIRVKGIIENLEQLLANALFR